MARQINRQVSFDRLLSAAERGGRVIFENYEGGVSASKHIDKVFDRTLSKVIGVYDENVKSSWLFDDLIYAGFQPV